MSDLISRMSLKQSIVLSAILEDKKTLEQIIDEQPSIDAVKHGRWLQKPNIFGVAYCSECDYELHTDDTNYCPACGARMDEGGNHETH